MSKNLNLKVEESTFYEFHRIKSLLRAGTNQIALLRILKIVDKKMDEFSSKQERDQFLKDLNNLKIG
ncbi:MAG: hypothetical protein ACTSVU_04840 [Promethearchaeota archaeon]